MSGQWVLTSSCSGPTSPSGASLRRRALRPLDVRQVVVLGITPTKTAVWAIIGAFLQDKDDRRAAARTRHAGEIVM
jgi:hypothetical protein